jgi:hypothetical protein
MERPQKVNIFTVTEIDMRECGKMGRDTDKVTTTIVLKCFVLIDNLLLK